MKKAAQVLSRGGLFLSAVHLDFDLFKLGDNCLVCDFFETGDGVEFKFFKSSEDVRKKFLKKVNPFNFRVRALIVEKSKIHSEKLQNDKHSFYSYTIKTAH